MAKEKKVEGPVKPEGYIPRLKVKYTEEIAPALMKKFEYQSVMQIPKMEKITVNCGCGEARDNAKVIDAVVADLTKITGQKPVVTKARKSVANFKLREGMSIGAKVTLRGERMWEFMDRLFSIALPRVRDFRGVPTKSFDGAGNYTFGLADQSVFTEVDMDKAKHTVGMNITIVTTAKTDDEARDLLAFLGMPFAKN